MKIVVKIIAILASIIGLMAIVTGTRVLLGFFDPDYAYFTALIVYNILMGLVSLIAGILIWNKNKRSIVVSSAIAGLHFVVLLLLLTVFREIISDQSIGAMIFRSSSWAVFAILIWIDKSKISNDYIE